MNSEAAIFTVGHGGRTVDEVFDLLAQRSIHAVVDVRSAPFSRYQPEFSKRPLEAACTARGLRYVFKGDVLGGRPSDPTCFVGGVVQYDLVRERSWFHDGLEWVDTELEAGGRLCLLCGERRPGGCHRALLVGEALAERGVEVVHIDENDRDVPQSELMRAATGGQRSLF